VSTDAQLLEQLTGALVWSRSDVHEVDAQHREHGLVCIVNGDSRPR